MKIIFVRHGHPNYKDDCLTPLGHAQAQAAAERLKDEKIDAFYASSCGRAYETAVHIADKHGKAVHKLDFMREIQWGPKGGNPHVDYNPWMKVSEMISDRESVMNKAWAESQAYKDNFVSEKVCFVGENFDKWLSEFGYERCGEYYNVTKENKDVILLASHGGSSSSVFSHIFNIPFTAVISMFRINFTSITEVVFEGGVGDIIVPKLNLFNDARHIENVDADIRYEM